MESSIGEKTPKDNKSVNLDLSIDPLTGECLASRTETALLANIKEDTLNTLEETNNNKNNNIGDMKGSYTENLLSPSNCRNSTGNIHIRKLSSDEELGNQSSSRRSSRSSRRKSSHLADIQEQYIPDEKILEVRIDPLTGQVETVEVCRSKNSPSSNSPVSTPFRERAASFSSQHSSPSENQSQDFDVEKRRKLSVEVTKMHSSTQPIAEQPDDGFVSLPDTPVDTFIEREPNLSVTNMEDGIIFPTLDDNYENFQRDQRETSAGASSGSGNNQYQSIPLDGGYGADSISSWDESSSVAPDDDGDELNSRPASAQPSNSTCTLTMAATSTGSLSSTTSTSSSTSALSNNNNNSSNTNNVNRTCSGAISRAMERLSASQPASITAQSAPTNSDRNVVNNSMEDKESDGDKNGSSDNTYNNSVMRRQSSPMVRPSSS